MQAALEAARAEVTREKQQRQEELEAHSAELLEKVKELGELAVELREAQVGVGQRFHYRQDFVFALPLYVFPSFLGYVGFA